MDAIEKRALAIFSQWHADQGCGPRIVRDCLNGTIRPDELTMELLRRALTPPEGFVLVEKAVFDSMREFVIAFPGISRNNAENLAAEIVEQMDAARPEVPNVND